MGSYFELLDKENDLSFNLSLLDCILLNEDSNLDSVEATIIFLIDEIQNQESEHTKASQKGKVSRRAKVCCTTFYKTD